MKTRKVRITVLAHNLGLCECCGALLTLQDVPANALRGKWKCPKCGKTLTNKSFGNEQIGDEWAKIYWVGEDGKWTDKKPDNDFNLGDWRVIVRI